jgi:hypothetical protein
MPKAVRIALLLLAACSFLAIWPATTQAATVTVPMGGPIYGPFWLCDSSHSGVVCTTTIQVGDTVTWQNTTFIAHTSTECDASCGSIPASPLWDSGLIPPSGTYSRQFNQIGTFNYQCNIHPTQMKGQIVVVAFLQTSTPTLTPTATTSPLPSPTPVPAVGGISRDLGTGAHEPSTSVSSGRHTGVLAAAIAAGAAAALVMSGAAWWTRKSRRR